jgi:hypothetical protein
MQSKKPMTVAEMARLGGETTFKKYGSSHYVKMVNSRKDRKKKNAKKKIIK